jgi:hypothetical protein
MPGEYKSVRGGQIEKQAAMPGWIHRESVRGQRAVNRWRNFGNYFWRSHRLIPAEVTKPRLRPWIAVPSQGMWQLRQYSSSQPSATDLKMKLTTKPDLTAQIQNHSAPA